MRPWSRIAAVGWVAVMTSALWGAPGMAQPRAHVYLFRGLADVYSLGMNTLADELNARGVYATAHSHTDWKPIADKAAADYKAGKEAPIILIGHSLGADAVMEMADYLGDKAVSVALVVPFDGTQSFPVPGNVGRVINFTQRDYAYMRPGTGFRGSLSNVDLSADHSIDHVTIDKSPQLHARVISEVLAIVGGRRSATPASAKRAPAGTPRVGASSGDGPSRSNETMKPVPESTAPTASPAPATTPASQKPMAAPPPANPVQIPD
jgi:alpha-beta hydrolase superfamily lysophospholipase